jgi:glycosyltransferase involved in cell wall biosynthesis
MINCVLVSNTDWYLYNYRLSLAKELRDSGFDVKLISPGGSYASLLEEQGFEWHEWQVGRQSIIPWQEMGAIRKLTNLYQKLKPDLVHHHTVKPVLYGGIAAKRAKVPAVVASITGRGYALEGRDNRAQLLEQIIKPIYRRALRSANTQVIFENESDQNFFIQGGLVTPNQCNLIESVGVDPEHFHPTPKPDGPVVILLASRMLWDKGVGVLVDAAKYLRRKGLEFTMALVGNPDPGNPTSISEEQLRIWEDEELLEWWGWQHDMQAIYSRCHIAVLPSFHEGVPTGLLEAAACGLPLVASDIPGCRSIVINGRTGILVPPGQPNSLATALETLILDPDLRGRMGKAGRKRILEHFTQKRINQLTIEVYRRAGSDQARSNNRLD